LDGFVVKEKMSEVATLQFFTNLVSSQSLN